MTAPDQSDPYQFVKQALSNVPEDPAEASVADIEVLSAIEAGLTRRTLETYAQQAQLATSVLRGTDLDAALDERARLAAEFASLKAADHLLNAYVFDAVRARGIDLDTLVAQAENLPNNKKG